MSHIYREGNVCADRLAHIGLSLTTYQYFFTLPVEVREAYVNNRLGMPSYKLLVEKVWQDPLLLFVTIFFIYIFW